MRVSSQVESCHVIQLPQLLSGPLFSSENFERRKGFCCNEQGFTKHKVLKSSVQSLERYILMSILFRIQASLTTIQEGLFLTGLPLKLWTLSSKTRTCKLMSHHGYYWTFFLSVLIHKTFTVS